MNTITLDASILSGLRPRQIASHKGNYGKVLIIAGSRTMVGAAALSALAAYRTGSGIVKIATEAGNESALYTLVPEALVISYQREMKAFSKVEMGIVDAIKWADAILIGPGLGTDWYSGCLLELVFDNASIPIVIDADAITLLSDQLKRIATYGDPIILTPHFGEMCRLTKRNMEDLQTQGEEIAQGFSLQNRVITVLKSHETIIATGESMYINKIGNPGMATAGCGDVLAGIITSLLGQGYGAEMSAAMGVYIHSMAGDFAKSKVGEYSLISRDIIDSICDVLKDVMIK